MGSFAHEAAEIERRLSDVESNSTENSDQLAEQSARIANLQSDLDDLESRVESLEGQTGDSWPVSPPDVFDGMIRHWSLASSVVTNSERQEWNSSSKRDAVFFTGDGTTALFWPVRPMLFSEGRFKAFYPGHQGGGHQWINYIWQPPELSDLFVPSGNQTPSVRVLHAKKLYRFGFDFMFSGLSDKSSHRITIWKTKPYIVQQDGSVDLYSIDSCPTLSIVRSGGHNDYRLRVILQADSDLITPERSELEVDQTWLSQMKILDGVIYRLEFEILYDRFQQGMFVVYITDLASGLSESVVRENAITTWLYTDKQREGFPYGAKNPYFGLYVTGSGNAEKKFSLNMDNIFCDRQV